MYYYMVLEDGETYTMLEGCKIIGTEIELEAIDDLTDGEINEAIEAIFNLGKTGHGKVVAEFTANSFVVSNSLGAKIDLP